MARTSLFLAISIVVSLFTSTPAYAGYTRAQLVNHPAFDEVNELLHSNLRQPTNIVPHYHVRPAPKFPGIYMWDSAFIALIWLNENPTIAKSIIRGVLHGQQKDGRIPHVRSRFSTSKHSNPLVLTWAAAKIAARTQDVKFAREIYPRMKAGHEWFWKNRQLKNGLFAWSHAYESGIDNTPRFGNRDESKYIDTTAIAAVDLSSYIVLDLESLQHLNNLIFANTQSAAERQALIADRERMETMKQSVSAKIRAYLWDEKTGYFYDRHTVTGKFIDIPTIASFFPMTSGSASRAQAARLLEHLRNPDEFNTVIPFPTVARNHRTFEKDCWRGPVWINTAYLVLQGMKRYGYVETAKYMGEKLVRGVYRTWEHTGKVVEFYDPDAYDFDELSRKKGTGLLRLSGSKNPLKKFIHLVTKQMFLGRKPVANFVGWSGLVNNIVLEDLSK